METLHASFLSDSSSVPFWVPKPIFLHGFSGLLHLLLLIGLISLFLFKKYRVGDREGSDQSFERKSRTLCYNQIVFCCSGVSLFNFVFLLLSYFFWYKHNWSDDNLVRLFDSMLRTVSWAALAAYLSVEGKLTFLLRAWLGLYLAISSYSLVVDSFLQANNKVSVIRFVASDIVSVSTGLFLCIMGFSKHMNKENTLLEKPLLNGEPCSKGSDTLTPYLNAGFFSTLTFSWMGSIIATGNKKTLNLDDVPQLYGEDTAAVAFPTFRDYLGLETGTVTTFKLVKALVCSFWKDILLTGLFSLIDTSATYVGPYLIDSFIQCLSGRGQFKNQGYLLVLIFFSAKLVECLSLRHWLFRLQQAGIRVKVVLVASIYNKGLTLSSLSRQGHSSGEIMNHMAVDAERISTFGWYIHDPWLVIFQVGFALLILYKNLGLASLAALAATVLVMLLNYPLGRLQETFQEKLMEWKDKRMKTTSEILRNMRILKLQGWEMKFLSRIFDLRKMEEKWLRTYMYASAMTNFIHWVAPTFVSVATFGACYLIGIPLESGKILSALATFRILQVPIYNLPDTISMLVQTKVSLDRIASFLRLEELQSDVVEKLPRCNSDTAIEIVNGNFSWDLSSSNPTLKDINLKVYHGIRVAVSGTVGSGKSSLLSCILGEMCKISGTVKLSGTKAYVSQSPWIQSGTVEENILFGKEMNREWYERILEACSLKKDLEILSFGDQTVIGERGINLSGGQKQRIQIARALYQDSDIYLLDDPFSAVDAHTGSHIFKEVILNLLSSKTVIYITHQLEFLPAADLILVMKDGMITQAGKYDEILTPGSDFMELVQAHKEALLPLDPQQEESLCENGIIREDHAGKKQENNVTQNGKSNEEVVPKRQIVQEEEREKGQVGFSVYWKYITAAYGGAFVPFILLAEILNQILSISSNYWMASATPESKDIKPATSESTLILVYVFLSIGTSVCLFVRVTLLVTAGYKTATLLFNKMHHCIFRAPMSFFDATPSGRILNRASTDQNQVDLQMAYQVGAVAFIMSEVLGIIGVMSQVALQILIVLIPVTFICIWYQKYYIPTARELSRLVGVCKAPILQHFAETVSGLTTIRSFDQETRFQETNLKLADEYSRPRFHVIGAMEWLCFRLDMFSCITFAVLLICIISFRDRIDLAIAGLAVTYGLNLNTLQTRVVWKICNLENKIISVERILQYLSIPSEPPLAIKEHQPDKSWPSVGEVAIDNLKVRYAPHMPLVLRGVSCIFPGGKKTGIVGRTGSGKSTLIQALFRIVEPSSGCIFVDGVNISTLGLHDLRSRLSIIPQDPTMFEGTVRSNLDPLEEYTDAQIWEALDRCQLGDEVRKKEKKLDSAVSENGENWSMGQRQLVCLGRVLLKRSKVLVLDEATASVDTATDNLIQQTIRQQFFDSTVIIIAHRITSVVDSDMVLLLSHGMVEEYGTPSKLLENKSSEFALLVAEYTMRSSSSSEM